MPFRRELETLLRRARGYGVAMTVHKRISTGEMTEEEARDWVMLLKNIKTDAKAEGEREGARKFAAKF